jgi:pimeloyl-ACP methyl ester carboxylesterase
VAGRDDRALPTALALLAGATAVAAGTAVQRRLRTVEGWHSSRTLTTRHRNELQYEVLSPGDNDQPVIVFAAAMVSASELSAWVTDRLAAETRYGIITYARAGYAGSHRKTTAPFRLSEAVDDLVDLVNGAVAPHRKVILVGHSLGGELARRTAAHLGDRLHGIVYLDSSHPDELNRSEQQSESAKKLHDSFTQMSWFMRLGTGILLPRPDWIEALPAAYREKVFSQYADARMWNAGRREWQAVEADFRSFTGELEQIHGVHSLVISAQKTVDRDPHHLLMHRELAEAHRQARTQIVVIEGADHDDILTRSDFAYQVSDHITAFFRDPDHHRQAPGTTGSAAGRETLA